MEANVKIDLECFFCGLNVPINEVIGVEYTSLKGRKFVNAHRDPYECIRLLRKLVESTKGEINDNE